MCKTDYGEFSLVVSPNLPSNSPCKLYNMHTTCLNSIVAYDNSIRM